MILNKSDQSINFFRRKTWIHLGCLVWINYKGSGGGLGGTVCQFPECHTYARTIPLIKSHSLNTGEVPACPMNLWTNHLKFLWNTPSPLIPWTWRIALILLLVVLDCQPPSNRVTKLSPISAILLPWRVTIATPSSWVTVVLPLLKLRPLVMAAFIRVSILRIGGVAWYESIIRGRRGQRNPPCAT